ncbi:MAG: YkgJ family cysteine cluster protein [Nitrospira sp.]|nr:YkgJ family cysteine cluster protein [Nitrospira sp.]MCA9477366.1 YkgJ family cysteine cluster protein [Nitrospira sp.]MCA9481448.1 YkgJ family cysteine cluster protein [Nitrospira sp.]MCB9711535.1 YkgJ family cysteine cluster protein [Nitrospiraceae bacterium]MDR4487352.1 YkgJ family cysteine cluster protein [Nitrospirales bacterium]
MMIKPQIVPSEECLRCDVCCRFPEANSFLRPYFTEKEIRQALLYGIDPIHFSDQAGCQIAVVPHPAGEGFLCPAFNHETHQCRLYQVRPFDCQLYPFALMWNVERDTVLFAWDPKCPYLLAQSGEDMPPMWLDIDPASLALPASLLEQAHMVELRLESEDTIASLVAHPRLITDFQPDIVILKPLPRLTAALRDPL